MNTRTLWIGAAVLAFVVGCNRTDGRTSSGVGSDRDRRAGNITLTGCLQPGEQGLASRDPNSASRSSEGVSRYVLANATSSDPAAGVSIDSAGPLYILEFRESELRRHVGQQVEVSGWPKAGSNSNRPNARRFEVDSVRTLSANCLTP